MARVHRYNGTLMTQILRMTADYYLFSFSLSSNVLMEHG